MVDNNISNISTNLSHYMAQEYARIQSNVCPPTLEETWVSNLPVCNAEPCTDRVWTPLLQGVRGFCSPNKTHLPPWPRTHHSRWS